MSTSLQQDVVSYFQDRWDKGALSHIVWTFLGRLLQPHENTAHQRLELLLQCFDWQWVLDEKFLILGASEGRVKLGEREVYCQKWNDSFDSVGGILSADLLVGKHRCRQLGRRFSSIDYFVQCNRRLSERGWLFFSTSTTISFEYGVYYAEKAGFKVRQARVLDSRVVGRAGEPLSRFGVLMSK